MKKILLQLLILFSASSISGQDFSGVRLMINAGHGGHDSDDRYIPMTGFWESESNLTKELYLRDILGDLCDTVVLSRTTNTTADDLPLSQISAIANENNMDFFLAIHSNANNQQSNFPLVLYRGYDNAPVFDRAKEMAVIMAEKLYAFNQGIWTRSEPEIRGDWSFYPDWGTSGLGVLRNLNMPGVLTEGSHHDYLMECWRLQNIDYRKKEAWCFAWSFREYFNNAPTSMAIDSFAHGLVAGSLRDDKRSTPYYSDTTTLDRFSPINNIKVTLQPGNRVFQGDAMNNGFFFFDSVSPGVYKLFFEAEEYFNDSLEITVNANQLTMANHFMCFDTTVVPWIMSYSPANSLTDSVASMQAVRFVFSHPMDTLSVSEAFSIHPAAEGILSWNSGHTEVSFIPVVPYEKAAGYNWELLNTARHTWQVPLMTGATGSFVTRNRNRTMVVDHYPRNRQVDVGTGVQFRMVFDAPLNQASLINAVELRDSSGTLLSLRNQKVSSLVGRGYYSSDPVTPLNPCEEYTFILKGTVADTAGNILYEPFGLQFTTIQQEELQGTLLDDFETASWSDPDASANTQYTDPSKTYYLPYNKYVQGGLKAGRMEYVFTSGGGVCYLPSARILAIPENTDTLGCWVFGDLSYNELACWFTMDSSSKRVVMDTLDFAGWKYLEVPSSGAVSFSAFELKALEGGLPAGTVYLDMLTASQPALSVAEKTTVYPELSVYPNPVTNESCLYVHVSDNTSMSMQITDITGRICREESVTLSSNDCYYKSFSRFGDLPGGLLIMRFCFRNERTGETCFRNIKILKNNN